MTHVTGGTVSYGETRKIGEYENKKAEVILHFGNPDGATVTDADLEGIHAQAQAHVHKRLGVEAAPAKRAARTPAEKAATEGELRTALNPPTAVTPVASPPVPAAQLPASAPLPAATASSDLTAIDLADEFVGVAPDITDKDLTDKLMAKNKATAGKLTLELRLLIGRYAGDGLPSHNIAKEKRAAFLAELEALKAPG